MSLDILKPEDVSGSCASEEHKWNPEPKVEYIYSTVLRSQIDDLKNADIIEARLCSTSPTYVITRSLGFRHYFVIFRTSESCYASVDFFNTNAIHFDNSENLLDLLDREQRTQKNFKTRERVDIKGMKWHHLDQLLKEYIKTYGDYKLGFNDCGHFAREIFKEAKKYSV